MTEYHNVTERRDLAPIRVNSSGPLNIGSGRVNLSAGQTPAPEQYERIHTEIERAAGPSRCFVVGVTSAVYGEGKTTVAMNLAVTIARNSPGRVALVDLNLRNRDLQSRLDLAPCAGIVELVEDEEEGRRRPDDMGLSGVVHKTELENFTILPAGRRSANPARLARSPRLGEVIGALRAANELVVIDMAPVLPVTDTRILSRLLDGVVMVVRAGVTPREIVARAIETVGEDRVLGVVLNGAEPTMPNWLNRLLGNTYSDL